MNKTQDGRTLVVIGAGPTGLGAAWRAHEMGFTKDGNRVVVFESTSEPGGLAGSIRDRNGFLWDRGGHVVFSHYKYFDDVTETAVRWRWMRRAAHALMQGADGRRRFIPYPVQHNVDCMHESDATRCAKELAACNATQAKKTDDFGQWLMHTFGEHLCERFLYPYNRKVWTVEPHEMNTVWVKERVATPRSGRSWSATGNSGLGEDSGWGPNTHFRYPERGGTGAIWKTIARRLPATMIHYESTCTKIDTECREVEITQADGKSERTRYDWMVSTMPLDQLHRMCGHEKIDNKTVADRFKFTHVHVIGVGLAGQPPDTLRDKSWIYFPDADAPFYRATMLSNLSSDHVPEPGQQWSIMCEVGKTGHSTGEPEIDADGVISETVKALCNYGFVKKESIISLHHEFLPYGYPIPFVDREQVLGDVQERLEREAIYSRGRFGGWRYEVSNQDHSFMQGVEVVDRIMSGTEETTYRPTLKMM